MLKIFTTKGVDLTGLLGGHKRRLGVWGMEVPQREPRYGVWGRSPPEAEAFFVKLHIIFALQYNREQLLSLESISETTSLLKYWGDITMNVPPS